MGKSFKIDMNATSDRTINGLKETKYKPSIGNQNRFSIDWF